MFLSSLWNRRGARRRTRPSPACSARWRRPQLECLEERTLLDVTGFTGGGQAFANTQPSLGLHYMIALQGIFPSRDDGTQAEGDVILGEVRLVPTNFAPSGWAFCNGQLLSINQNTALFSLLGTTYGGDGQTTFALPNLQDSAVAETGQGPGLPARTQGQPFGADTVTLTVSQIPSHDHTLPGGGVTGNTGGGQPFDNTQPSLPLQYYIQPFGVFNYLSEVRLFAGTFAPGDGGGNGFAANGQLVSISQNQALFQLLGTTYGGNGTTTFAVPDLRGRVAVSDGQGPGLSNYVLGESIGAESVTLTTNQFPVHVHTLPGGGGTGIAGGSQPFYNVQPTLALHYAIAVEGIYPSRPAVADNAPQGGGASGPFLGEIRAFASESLPDGWVATNGQLLSIIQNTALFSLLGTTYGGDGQTTFALPDLRGRVAVDAGTGQTTRVLGEQFGAESVTLTIAQIPSHDHTLPAPGGPTDVTGKVQISRSGLAANRRAGTFAGTIGITNTGGAAISGGLVFVWKGMAAGVSVQSVGVTINGVTTQLTVGTDGSGNKQVVISSALLAQLASGQSITLNVVYSDPTFTAVNYVPDLISNTSL